MPRLCDALRSTEQHHRHLALFAKQLDERPAHASRYVPIDRPHIVADLVRPHFLELDAATLERRIPLPREQLVHDARRMNLDTPNLLDNLAWEHVKFL